MTHKRWILLTAAVIFLVIAANVVAMVVTDNFGVFRNPSGRQLAVYYADRTGKCLLSSAYVPANFDALLIGPSSSVNWLPGAISQGTSLHMYNESLEGANSTEEKFLVDRAIVRGHFRLALVVVFPTMVRTHDFQEALDKVGWTEALGSLDIFTQTILSQMTRHHLILSSKQNSSPDGSHEMRNPKGNLDPSSIDCHLDPIGVQNLRAMVKELQQHGTRVIYVMPPVYQPLLNWNASDLARFTTEIKLALPRTPIVDLNAPEYLPFRARPDNFIDGLHLTSEGATEISRILNIRLKAGLTQ